MAPWQLLRFIITEIAIVNLLQLAMSLLYGWVRVRAELDG